jgi:hypothetical protein
LRLKHCGCHRRAERKARPLPLAVARLHVVIKDLFKKNRIKQSKEKRTVWVCKCLSFYYFLITHLLGSVARVQ